jgi:sulfate transport system ATP-binding protein
MALGDRGAGGWLMRVEIRDLTKLFGRFTAVDRVSLEIEEGAFYALLGPSGSGKTTLLRIIAGLEFPDAGSVRFAGEDVLARDARERQVGFVFQHYALFRHLTVFENVAFGLRVRPRAERPDKAQIRARVLELLRLVQLEGLAQRYPSQLSGGQRQRVALARALAIEPRVLLLDEPFGALDAKVRKELRRWLRALHQRLGLTSIFVTHDQEEALELADRVVVMDHGRIEQVGRPSEIYDRPATPFVYEFLGGANRLPCRVHDGRIELFGVGLGAPAPAGIEGDALLFVRPQDLRLVPDGRAGSIPAVVKAVVTTGPAFRLDLAIAGLEQEIEAELPKAEFERLQIGRGDRIGLLPHNFGLFPAPQQIRHVAVTAPAAPDLRLAASR